VHGATLGILGMGRIGQAVAKRALGFDMQVLYYSRHQVAADIERACRARHVALDALLAESDIVTIHTPYSSATHHLIGADELAKMKTGALLIHAARGGVVDDLALISALKAGRLGGAGLDVFEGEPKLNPEFLTFKNVVLAPHIASSTARTRQRMAMLAAENLVAALSTGRPPNLLNP
jgi:lactate dehydrogenase-like 2-hydroxyacid dehydrogenase